MLSVSSLTSVTPLALTGKELSQVSDKKNSMFLLIIKGEE